MLRDNIQVSPNLQFRIWLGEEMLRESVVLSTRKLMMSSRSSSRMLFLMLLPTLSTLGGRLSPLWMLFMLSRGMKCNTPCKSYQNERNPETLQVWDYIVKNDLKKLIGLTYTNKMHLLFGNISLKNSTVKCVWL